MPWFGLGSWDFHHLHLQTKAQEIFTKFWWPCSSTPILVKRPFQSLKHKKFISIIAVALHVGWLPVLPRELSNVCAAGELNWKRRLWFPVYLANQLLPAKYLLGAQTHQAKLWGERRKNLRFIFNRKLDPAASWARRRCWATTRANIKTNISQAQNLGKRQAWSSFITFFSCYHHFESRRAVRSEIIWQEPSPSSSASSSCSSSSPSSPSSSPPMLDTRCALFQRQFYTMQLLFPNVHRYCQGRKENPSSFANPPPRAYRPQLQVEKANSWFMNSHW